MNFLLLDEEFPHSLRFSIDGLQQALEAIHARGRQRTGRMPVTHASPDVCRGRSATRRCRGDSGRRYRRLPAEHPGSNADEIHNTIYELIHRLFSIQAALAS